MSTKPKPFNLKTHVVSALRRTFLRSATRQQFLAKHRFRKVYTPTGNEVWHLTCVHCKQDIRQNEIKVDHIIPIVTTDKGWESFDQFIMGLFCMDDFKGFPDLSRLQALCKPCHKEKTAEERKARAKGGK